MSLASTQFVRGVRRSAAELAAEPALAPLASRRGSSGSYRLTVTPTGPPPKFHDDPDILDALSRREQFTAPADLVFPNRYGEHLDPTSLRRRYTAARDRAAKQDGALPVLRFHDLRHTFGSLAASAGVDIVLLRSWLGHADVQTTMRYLHARSSADDAVGSRASSGTTTLTAM